MTQFDMPTIDPAANTGAQLSSWLNSWQQALESGHAGAARPTYVRSGMMWVQQVSGTLWTLNLYDGVQDIAVMSLNPSGHTALYNAPEAVVSEDWDAIVKAGVYRNSQGSAIGIPVANITWCMKHEQLPGAANRVQTAWDWMSTTTENCSMYVRTYSAGTWSAWYPVAEDCKFITPTYLNSFTAAGNPMQYKRVNGLALITGQVTRSTGTANIVIFTLPAGFRPSKEISCVGSTYGSGNNARQPVAYTIGTNGDVKYLWSVGAGDSAAPTPPITYDLNVVFPVVA